MSFLDFDHETGCTGPSTFYTVRDGLCWLACRRCGATVVRPPAGVLS